MADQAPLPNYDKLTASEIVGRMRDADRDLASAVLAYESENENRTTVVDAATRQLRQLEQEAADAAVEEDKPVFSLGQLRTREVSGLLRHEVQGAYHGLPDDHTVTIEDARSRIEEWLNKAEERDETDPNIRLPQTEGNT